MDIVNLTKEIAIEYQKEILYLHNLIPFQNWNKDDLLCDNDENRTYKDKWVISSVCFNGQSIVGVCIAFENNQSVINGISNFLYLHRIAVHPEYRFKGIGRRLIIYSCQMFLDIDPSKLDSNIFVLTPIRALDNVFFENAEEFYLKLGFNRVGERNYYNKVDSILTVSVNKLITK